MNIHILPNWSKKVGIVLFLVSIGVLIMLFAKLVAGVEATSSTYDAGYLAGNRFQLLVFEELAYGLSVGRIVALLTMVGMILYLMSKEKIEDEYIAKLRLESYQLTLLLLTCFFLVLLLLGINISSMLVLFLFFGIYLLVFATKKRS